MNEILKVLKALLPGHTDKVYKGIVSMLGLENANFATGEDSDENSTTIAKIAGSLKSLGYKINLPGMEEDDEPRSRKSNPIPFGVQRVGNPGEDEEDEEDEGDARHRKAMNAFYINRYGERKDAVKAILKDVFEAENYRQTVYDQNIAFAKYLRSGDAKDPILKRQFFPEDATIKAVLDEGFDVRTIKATQVEAQGDLGGIAVPPNRQSDITTRLPGLTAVRGGGATVITLVNSNSIEIPQWKSDDLTHRYIGMLRGQWGSETASPNDKNFKLEMVPVVADVYTYKVPMSQSLVEDAANLVSKLMEDIAITRAIDEDEVFLVGDGVGKALGILPNGENLNSLREVVTGDADEVTPIGIKALKRGVPSQYRRNCVFVGQSDTWGYIETLRDNSGGAGTGQFLFPDLSENDRLLARQVYESEALPAVAANAFPIIFGWMMGYDIVERLGMTIQRFQDSGTGPNKVEYHVRCRVGGRLERPWMFALQKVATGDPFS